MQDYEIHVIGAAGESVHHALLTGDYAAIRRASALAGTADQVEVWKDAVCIFSTGPLTPGPVPCGAPHNPEAA